MSKTVAAGIGVLMLAAAPSFAANVSLETEGYLDAVNHPDFPSTVVEPGKPLHEVTLFRFGPPR